MESLMLAPLFCSCFFFFFSSRRRHTRLQGDWSSDVCSSDLRLKPSLLATTVGGRIEQSWNPLAAGPNSESMNGCLGAALAMFAVYVQNVRLGIASTPQCRRLRNANVHPKDAR